MFRSRALRYGDSPCLSFKKEGTYHSISWIEVLHHIEKLANFLLSQGLAKGDRVGILSENRPEWAFTDLAILAIGCVTVPIYPTLPPHDVRYILEDSGVKTLWVSKQAMAASLSEWQGTVLSFEGGDLSRAFSLGEQFLAQNRDRFSSRAEETEGGDLASIIYTSGTTGDAKGVMLTHENFLSNCRACCDAISISEEDLYLSFLPLSHVFERMAGFYFMLFQGASIAYAENMDCVFQNIQEVQPTVMSGVPRFFEKVREGMLEKVEKASPMKRRLFLWALEIGKRRAQALQNRTSLSWKDQLQYPIASRMVLRKVRRKIGQRLRFFISGSAPLSTDLIAFFSAFGCIILEGYGLTETSPVISVNRPDRWKWGSVGLSIPGVEVKIAEDGEIMVKGPNVMQGYYRREEETRNTFREGYLLTGDIGELDEEGFLFITDRKKDLIKTSGGKFVSPQKIEALLKRDPLIEEAVVFGDRQKYIVALLFPDIERLKKAISERGISIPDPKACLKDPRVVCLVQERVDRSLADVARFEQVKKIALLDRELTQTGGDLTPTLKIKRQRLYSQYQNLINTLYGEKDSGREE